jgi:hypothetical protein
VGARRGKLSGSGFNHPLETEFFFGLLLNESVRVIVEPTFTFCRTERVHFTVVVAEMLRISVHYFCSADEVPCNFHLPSLGGRAFSVQLQGLLT